METVARKGSAEVKCASKTTDNDRLLKDHGRQVSSLIRRQHEKKKKLVEMNIAFQLILFHKPLSSDFKVEIYLKFI